MCFFCFPYSFEHVRVRVFRQYSTSFGDWPTFREKVKLLEHCVKTGAIQGVWGMGLKYVKSRKINEAKESEKGGCISLREANQLKLMVGWVDAFSFTVASFAKIVARALLTNTASMGWMGLFGKQEHTVCIYNGLP